MGRGHGGRAGSVRVTRDPQAAAGGASGLVLDVKPDYYGVKHRSLLELGTGWGYVEDLSAMSTGAPQGPGPIVGRRSQLARSKAAVAKEIYG